MGREILEELKKRIKLLEDENNSLFTSEKKCRELIEYLPEMIIETDKNGKITFVNDAVRKKFDYSKSDFKKGMVLFDIIIPEEQKILKKHFRNTIIKKKTEIFDYTARRKDGSEFPIAVHSSLINDDSGKATGTRAILLDITDRLNAEKERIRLSNIEAINKMVVTLNHEMNQPLAVICTGTELIMKGMDKKDPLYNELKLIFNAAWKLAELVRKTTNLRELKTVKYVSNIDMIALNDFKED